MFSSYVWWCDIHGSAAAKIPILSCLWSVFGKKFDLHMTISD